MSERKSAPVSESEASFDAFAIAGQVAKALSGLSNSQAKAVLSLVSSQYGMRLAPVGVAIAAPTRAAASAVADAKQIQPPQRLAPWKASADWQKATAARTAAVAAVKTASEAERESALASLRSQESAMRALKERLQRELGK